MQQIIASLIAERAALYRKAERHYSETRGRSVDGLSAAELRRVGEINRLLQMVRV